MHAAFTLAAVIAAHYALLYMGVWVADDSVRLFSRRLSGIFGIFGIFGTDIDIESEILSYTLGILAVVSPSAAFFLLTHYFARKNSDLWFAPYADKE